MIHLNVIEILILALALALSTWVLKSELAAIEPRSSLRDRRNKQRVGFAGELLYQRLIRPDVIKLANGAYLAMFEIRLPTKEELNEQTAADADLGFAKALSQWGSDTVLHLHDVHRPFAEYDVPRTYPHPVLAWLDEIRREWFLTPGRVFASRYVLSITWMPPKNASAKIRAALASGVAQAMKTENDVLATFARKCDEFASLASSYGDVRRLGARKEPDRVCSEMLEHLSWCVSGRTRNVRVPIAGQALNGLLAEEFARKPLRIGEHYVRIVVVSMLPGASHPLQLDRLRDLAAPYSLVVRFLPDDGDRARKIVHDAHVDWVAKSNESNAYVDPHAADQAESARQAIGAIAQGAVRFGRTSVFIVLRHPTEHDVNDLAQRCVAKLDQLGFTSYIAGWTAEDDFLATLPGDGYHSLRKHMIHALNVAHLFSTHGENLGRRYNGSRNLPSDTPAIFYATTPAKAQVRVHLSDRDITDVGHHLGIGGTGSGKSVLLGALAAGYMARFPGAGFTGIDKGRSLYRLTRFLDGTFYDLLGPASPGFALFSDVDDPDQARCALEIIREMVQLQGVRITPMQQSELEDAMRNVAVLPQRLRSLTAYWEALQDRDNTLRPALRNYTVQSSALGNVLDYETDTFASSHFNVVEIGHLSSLGEAYLIPVLRTLFWKARSQARMLAAAEGARNLHWLYQIDEAHELLKNDIGCAFIKSFLKEGRKEKFTVGLWSNAAQDFVNHKISNDLNEACRSRFFFKNPEVETDERTRALYAEDLGVPARGLTHIPHLPPRHVLFTQPKTGETWVLDAALDKAWLAVVGRTDKRDNERVDEFIAAHGNRWREELLRYEGVPAHQIEQFTALMRGTHELIPQAS
jgi:type IV secretory pathway VirB4 component